MRSSAVPTSRRARVALLLSFGALGCAPRTSSETETGTERAARPDVVLVVLDTVRRDVCDPAVSGGAGSERWPSLAGGRTPNLARLAAESAVFTRACSGGAWTVPSHASMFTGLLPNAHGCFASRPRLADAVGPTAAEVARDAGYETAAFFSNPWLTDEATGLLRGFETHEQAPIGGLDALVDTSAGRGDQGGAHTLRNVAAWLERRDRARPFFLFVNFLEAHLPYDPPPAVRALFTPPLAPDATTTIQWAHAFNAGLQPAATVDWKGVEALYAADVRAADALLGELRALLERHGHGDEVAWIVTSDHGENVGDHGLMEHQFSLHETLVGVPLVARLPRDLLPAGRYDEPVSTLDVYATIGALVGGTAGQPRPFSHALQAPPEPERSVFSDYFGPHPGLVKMLAGMNPELDVEPLRRAWRGVRAGDRRLSASNLGDVLLHDLAADPAQTHDLTREKPRVAEMLMGRLQASQDTSRMGGPPPGPGGEIDPETLQKLRDLGYVGDEREAGSGGESGDR